MLPVQNTSNMAIFDQYIPGGQATVGEDNLMVLLNTLAAWYLNASGTLDMILENMN